MNTKSSAFANVDGRLERGVPATRGSAVSSAAAAAHAACASAADHYRPSIDGLRGVAILSVLGFHAFSRLVPGGFVGVDVFFVISGYLLTGIILRELASGRFSFEDFYCRRMRRILPALAVVLVSVLAFGWLKFYPDEFKSLAQQVVAGCAFVSNFVLYKESGYFDTNAELKPLLHLWSLAIEEQFYIIWPILLVFTWKRKGSQWHAILALIGISFALNVLRLKLHAAATFYLPPTRLWELACGGALARLEMSRPQWLPRSLSGVAAVAGAALLAASIVALDRYQLYPGWRASAPVLGTSLLIAAGETPWVNRSVLSHPAMTFTGQISYSLYLWHWPLLSLGRVMEDGNLSPSATACALALAVILAVLTRRYIEVPALAMRPPKRIAVPVFAATVGIGVIAMLMLALQVGPLSSHYGVQRILRGAAERAFTGPHLQHLSGDPTSFLAHRASATQALFIGDSNLEQYYPRIDLLLSRDPAGFRTAVFATGGGCPPIPGVHEDHHAYCEGIVDRAREYARDPAVDTVIIGAAWQAYFKEPDSRYSYYFRKDSYRSGLQPGEEGARRAFQALDELITEFVLQGKTVVLITQIPAGKAVNPRAMIRRSLWHGAFEIHSESPPRGLVATQVAEVDRALMQIARHRSVQLIDPMAELCGPLVCPTLDSRGEPIYHDGAHLRPSYVRDHVLWLDDVLRLKSTLAR